MLLECMHRLLDTALHTVHQHDVERARRSVERTEILRDQRSDYESANVNVY